MTTTMQQSAQTVISENDRAAAVITLNRPKALNALNAEMRAAIAEAIHPLTRNPEIYALVLRSTSAKAFCAGGDVRELVTWAKTDRARAKGAFAAEYQLDWALECLTKPSVSLADGFVMGSGAGLTAYNTHRVGGERYAFAMPETAIGFFPDVGIAHALARMPGHIGAYLGLTGARLGRDDAFHLGLLTHLISADQFDDIQERLAEAWPIDDVLDDRHMPPGSGELSLPRSVIDDCFGAENVQDILSRLEVVVGTHHDWAQKTLKDLKARSPIALEVTLQHIRKAARYDLRETLQMDYHLAVRFLEEPDFAEGVRAALIDKDGQPNWQPAELSDVSQERVAAFFKPDETDALVLPSREDMQR
ncbi:MAG: enoyl-CoA hydratase/isomerase family protein [Pseudomonadota bacterium]